MTTRATNHEQRPPRREPSGRSSVVFKLALIVAPLLVLTTGLMSGAGYYVARQIGRAEIHERLRVAATDRHKMITAYVAQQHERIQLVASRTQLRKLVEDHVYGGQDAIDIRLRTATILRDAKQSTKGFVDIWIVGADGSVITATDDSYLGMDFSNDASFQRGLFWPNLGEPEFVGGAPYAILAAPAKTNDGQLLGVVMVLLDATEAHRVCLPTRTVWARRGKILVATRSGDDIRYLHRAAVTRAFVVDASLRTDHGCGDRRRERVRVDRLRQR